MNVIEFPPRGGRRRDVPARRRQLGFEQLFADGLIDPDDFDLAALSPESFEGILADARVTIAYFTARRASPFLMSMEFHKFSRRLLALSRARP